VVFGLDLDELELYMSAGVDWAEDAGDEEFMSGTGTLTRLSIFFAFKFKNLKRLTVQCNSNGGVSVSICVASVCLRI
jgi:hypothetical protein